MIEHIVSFEEQVMRAFNDLMRLHPVPVELSVGVTHPHVTRQDPNFDQAIRESGGTVLWLVRNGVVKGAVSDEGYYKAMYDAQLSLLGYRIAKSTHPNVGRPFEVAIPEALEANDRRNIDIIGQALVESLF